MTTLLDRAVEVTRQLPQDELARVLLRLIGDVDDQVYCLSPKERDAIDRSVAQAGRGEFAADEAVREAWGKHGL